MAERRRFADLNYGQAGQLTYIPRDNPQYGPGLLHTRRFTSEFPHFNIVGSSAELYPPSKSPEPQASSRLWQERRLQKRWLLKSHPEAFMGSSALQEVLTDDMKRFREADATPRNGPLLAVGQISDVRDPDRISETAVLACATGQSGELLRLARIQESQWQWGENNDSLLNLSIIDPDDREEEVIWASDGLPISQIKFATSLTRYDPMRWIIVQKQTSTVILQPQYHAIPVSESRPEEMFQQLPSRIDPNPLLSLSHHQTGGNAHSDVVFNPRFQGQPPQLIIIDECGYWSVWDILGTSQIAKQTLRPSLSKCGHIWEGWITELPTSPTMSAEKHGALLLGRTKDDFWDTSSRFKTENVNALASSGQHILIWNRERFEVFDMEVGSFLPRIPNFVAARGSPDLILDVQQSPVNQDHVFVLTSRYIFWIEILCRQEGNPPSRPKIILTCPLSAQGDLDERMTVCPASRDDTPTSMVFIYSPRAKQLSSYWFTLSVEYQLPQWHRHILAFPQSNNAASHSGLDLLRVFPAEFQIVQDEGPGTGPGSRYRESGVRFFQGNILGEDLSVRYCIFTACSDPALEVTLPTTRFGWSRPEQKKRWKKKRRQFLRHMESTFVLPDGMTDEDLDSLVQPRTGVETLRHDGRDEATHVPRLVRLDFERVCLALRDTFVKPENENWARLSAMTLEAVRTTLENGISIGSLPFMTWKEAAAQATVSHELEESTDDPEDAIRSLFDMASEEVVVTQLGRHSTKEPVGSVVSLSSLKSHFSELWLDPLENKLPEALQRRRRAWIEGLAKDMLLSTCGVMVQEVPVLGLMKPDTTGSSQKSMPSSMAAPSSPPHSRGVTSSPPASTASTGLDAAFQRLQLLSPSLHPGQLGTGKQASVLSYWPSERGVDIKDYVSSVAAASDRQFDDARARLRKAEAKRKAQAERYRRPAFMRQGLSAGGSSREEASGGVGPVQAQSSQGIPPSSQTQGPPVTMSQPVAGAFGDRKKVKKGKRKSGFR